MAEQHPEGLILDVTPGTEAFERSFLERLGHPVLVCHGPGGEVCPLIEDGSCEMLSAAHGVVFQLDLERQYHRDILQRYIEVLLPADIPLRVVVTEEQAEQYADLLRPVRVWTHTPTAGELDGFAARVEAADQLVEASDEGTESPA